MKIPEDIRETIYDALNTAAEYIALGGEDWKHLEEAQVWLDAQADAPQRWEPVDVLPGIACACGDSACPNRLHYLDDGEVASLLLIHDYKTDNSISVELPADLRLCRRVEVTE